MSSVIVDDEFYFGLQSLFRELPESAQQVLGDRLMLDAAWKQVADGVGFTDTHIGQLAFIYTSRAASQMLREWGQRRGSTLLVLRQTLRDIERPDIISFLDDIRKRKLTSHQA